MQVRLINSTYNVEKLMIYTKSTRLTLGKDTEAKINAMTQEEVDAELEYMANTIPSSWEFCDFTFEVLGVSRAFTHQMVRTRQASYAQQTQRMLNMEKFDYVSSDVILGNELYKEIYDSSMAFTQTQYDNLIYHGCPAEDARGILPTNICTNIIAKYNLRTFSELAKSRTGGRTQSEYVKVMNAMVDEVLKVHPWADKFLFPKGRDAFVELEKMANELKKTNMELGVKCLKQIDILRKECK